MSDPRRLGPLATVLKKCLGWLVCLAHGHEFFIARDSVSGRTITVCEQCLMVLKPPPSFFPLGPDRYRKPLPDPNHDQPEK